MTQEHIEYLKDQEKGTDSRKNMNKYMGGSMAIAMGVFFLLALNLGFSMAQVWPLFILIPAAFSGFHIVQDIRAGRDVNMSSVMGLLTMVLIGSVWIFNWNWGTMWPLFMIIGGFYAFSNASKAKG